MKDRAKSRASNRAYWNRLKANRPEAVAKKRAADRYSAHRQARRYIKNRQPGALVKWADNKVIRGIYLHCAEINKVAIQKYEVDHIVPLLNDTVCGLHCQYNMRIITEEENNRKNNHTYDEDNNVDLMFATDDDMFPDLADLTGGGGFPY